MKKIVFTAVIALVLASCGTSSTSTSDAPPREGRKGPFTDKRGVCYSFEQDKTYEQDMELLSSGNGVKWFYNWGVIPDPNVDAARKIHNVAFYPMAWNDMGIDNWREKMLEAYLKENPDVEWLMGYNEPNLTDQCNYTPARAAKSWPKLVKFAKKHNLKIVSPAMNYGSLENYESPWVWLDEFFGIDYYNDAGYLVKCKGYKGVSLDDIDVISIHCYMPDTGALKKYVNAFLRYGKPIWVTEFCSWVTNAPWQTAEWQANYMSEAVTMLELHPDVEKYAWCIPKAIENEKKEPFNKLLTKTVRPNFNPPRLTPLGQIFVNMGTCDKNVWVPAGERITAAHFADTHLSEYVLKEEYPAWPQPNVGFKKGAGVHFRPGTDSDGAVLDMFNFSNMMWVEYQVETPEEKTYTLSLRNTAEEETEIAITVNGNDAGSVTLAPASNWRTDTVSLQLAAGKNQLRLKVIEGDCALNWLLVD
jgi:hypothetical protein